MKKRHSEEQIIRILREAEAKLAEALRREAPEGDVAKMRAAIARKCLITQLEVQKVTLLGWEYQDEKL